MSTRATHYYSISTSAGIYRNYDEALKEANALKMSLYRECKRNNYSCISFIGVSENDSDEGMIQVGVRGAKQFTSFLGKKSEKSPHLHIIVLATPGETLSKYIRDYLNRNQKSNCCWSKCCDEYLDNVVPYVMRQCRKYRVASCNLDNLPQEQLAKLCQTTEAVNKSMGGVTPIFKGISDEFFSNSISDKKTNFDDPFTDSIETVNATTFGITSENSAKWLAEKLQCNNKYINIFNYIYYYINYIYLRVLSPNTS